MDKGKKSSNSTKSYLKWTPEMDEALLEVLVEYHNKGEHCQNGWKSHIYTATINNVREKCKIVVTKDNLIGRMRTFDKHYSIVSKILATSGFGWDWERKKLQMDSIDVWNRYVEANPRVSQYKDKEIHHWELISLISSKDHASGECARTGVENINEMIIEDNVDVEEITPDPPPPTQSPVAPSTSNATTQQRQRKVSDERCPSSYS